MGIFNRLAGGEEERVERGVACWDGEYGAVFWDCILMGQFVG